MSLLEMSLRFCANRPQIDSVIVGISKMAQLAQNVEYLTGQPLEHACLQAIDAVWAQLPLGARFKYYR